MGGSEKKTPLMIIAPRTSPPVRPRILPRLIFEESRFTSNIPKHLNLPPAMRLMPSNFRLREKPKKGKLSPNGFVSRVEDTDISKCQQTKMQRMRFGRSSKRIHTNGSGNPKYKQKSLRVHEIQPHCSNGTRSTTECAGKGEEMGQIAKELNQRSRTESLSLSLVQREGLPPLQ